MLDGLSSRLLDRYPDLRLALVSIIGFWSFYFATVLVRSALLGQGQDALDRRALGILVGGVLTFFVYLLLRRAEGQTLTRTVVVAALSCLPAAALFATFNHAFMLQQPLVTQVLSGREFEPPPSLPDGEVRVIPRDRLPAVIRMPAIEEALRNRAPRMIADATVTWYFFFAAWASFYIAMSAASKLRRAERQAAEFQRQAQSAQLRALRYQVNPHFLFNTLNSLSSLVMARRSEEAERMIVNLSTFFRSSLTLDPSEDVTLLEELEYQKLYLDIEKVRFPSRLKVEASVPKELAAARVPPLILQPVVENAIKYGVARSTEVITLSISARRDGDRLVLEVANDGACDSEGGREGGTGVGLANVCERLAARFGDAAACEHGPLETGGYRVSLSMPLLSHG
jgi:hypothetical protein